MRTLMGILLVVTAGVVPMVVYALVLWWFDRYEKEPWGLLLAAFGWGAVPAVLFSLLAQLILKWPISSFVRPEASSLVQAAVVAPLTEELFKGSALVLLFVFFRDEIDSAIDGILYGGLVGFGFAAVENTLYLGGMLMEAGFGGLAVLVPLRAFVFGLNHAMFTGLFGLGIAWGYSATGGLPKVAAPLVGLMAGIGAHAIHNASVVLGAELGWPCMVALASNWAGVLTLLLVLAWTSVRERRWIEQWLNEEVDRGVLTQEEYAVALSQVSRVTERVQALMEGDFRRWQQLGRFHRLAAKLAFNKQRASRFPDDVRAEERVERLRAEVEEAAGRPRA